MKKLNLTFFLKDFEKSNFNIYLDSKLGGYWSNLSKNENNEIVEALDSESPMSVVEKYMPNHHDVIFSLKRAVGLELLNLNGSETALDLGCMWGALTIPLSKQVKQVLAVDQTLESLIFSKKRASYENLSNIDFLRTNLRDVKLPKDIFDIAIVNGVLEWIPEFGDVELHTYFNEKSVSKTIYSNPKQIQLNFLSKIHESFKSNGKLYLAIENRFDYSMFLGIPDPHSNVLFTSILPKKIANIYHKFKKGRDYRTWIYSFNETRELISDSGFDKVKIYSCWPDYRFPEQIFEYGELDSSFKIPSIRRNGKIKIRLVFKAIAEYVLFKVLKLDFFAPSIIVVAEK